MAQKLRSADETIALVTDHVQAIQGLLEQWSDRSARTLPTRVHDAILPTLGAGKAAEALDVLRVLIERMNDNLVGAIYCLKEIGTEMISIQHEVHKTSSGAVFTV